MGVVVRVPTPRSGSLSWIRTRTRSRPLAIGTQASTWPVSPPAGNRLSVELLVDLWHLAFANLIQLRAPPNFEVRSEVRLNIEPQRADLLLLRRLGVEPDDHEALILHGLWPRLGLVTVLEYKSPVDSAFRRGDLRRLVGYGVLYKTAHLDELPTRDDLMLVLVVASVTPTLLDEIECEGWRLTPLGGGYARIEGVMYTAFVVITDEVEGLAPEQLLAGLTPEQLLAGLPPEQRLQGLTPEQVPLAVPLEMLRALPEEYVLSLPPEVLAQIRKRLQEAAH